MVMRLERSAVSASWTRRMVSKLLGAAPVRALERVRVERRQVRGGGDVLALLGAGDLHGALDHAVQQLRLFALRSLVVDLLAVAAADDQSALTQLAQVMRERGRAHAHHGREVDHALLAVAQKPEEPHAVCVGELAKDQRDGLKILGPAEVLLQFMQMRGVLVLMGKLKRFHISAPFPVVPVCRISRLAGLFARSAENAAKSLTFSGIFSIVQP